MVNVEAKLRALAIKNLFNLFFSESKSWHSLAWYYLGISHRQFLPRNISFNSFPKCVVRTHWYDHIFDSFNIFSSLNVMCSAKVTVKEIYCALLGLITEEPRVKSKYPLVNWGWAFKYSRLKSMSIEGRDITFRMLHRCLPVNSFLYYKINCVRSPLCEFCKSSVESIEHLFFSCSIVKCFWDKISNVLKDVSIDNCNIDQDAVVFNNFKEICSTKYYDLYSIVLSEGRDLIWRQRNGKKFDNKTVNSNTLWFNFKSILSNRIKADFIRLSSVNFSSAWVEHRVFCSIASFTNERQLVLLI